MEITIREYNNLLHRIGCAEQKSCEVSQKIDSLITNGQFVTTSTDQNSLSGNKVWTGDHTFNKRVLFEDVWSNEGQASFGKLAQGGAISFIEGQNGTVSAQIGFVGATTNDFQFNSLNGSLSIVSGNAIDITSNGSSGNISISTGESTGYFNVSLNGGQVLRAFSSGNTSFGDTTDSGATIRINKSKVGSGGVARSVQIVSSHTGGANNDVLVALDISSTFVSGGFSNVVGYAIRHTSHIGPSVDITSNLGTAALRYASVFTATINSGGGTLSLRNTNIVGATLYASGRIGFQAGGTFTDDGLHQVQVTGNTRLNGGLKHGTTTFSGSTFAITTSMYTISFTGTTTTITLPTLTGNDGAAWVFIHKGSGNATLNSNAGGNDIQDGLSVVNTLIIDAGSTRTIRHDGAKYVVY